MTIKIIMNCFYIISIFIILLGYFYVSLDKIGIVISGLIFLSVSIFIEYYTYNISFIKKLFYFVVLVFLTYLVIGIWMTNNAPGGTYSPVTGHETRAWWVDGAYTEFGQSLVWRWVGWGVLLYVFAEGIRQCSKLFESSEMDS